MVWVKLDDQFPQHPKVVQVGPLGIAMQVAGLCYCSRFLTDGFIPASAVPTFMDFSELDEHAFNGFGNVCWKAVGKLLDAGMWEKAEGGYQIHDYLAYQPSRAKAMEERESNRIRQERFKGNAVINTKVTPLVTKKKRVNNSAPVPVPVPVPKTRTQDQKIESERDAASPPHTLATGPLPFDDLPKDTEGRDGKPRPSLTVPAADPEVLPDWYHNLWAIKGFTVPLADAQKWLTKKGITEDIAETAAISLKSKWPGPTKSPYRDPWATFQNWAKNEKARSGNGISTTGAGALSGQAAPRAPLGITLGLRAGSKYGEGRVNGALPEVRGPGGP